MLLQIHDRTRVLRTAAVLVPVGQLMMVDRALGAVARRIMQPFSRKVVV